MAGDLIEIEAYDNPHKADLAKMRLESAGIKVFLENRLIVETDWFLSNAIGNIKMHVPAADEAAAREILDAMKRDRPIKEYGAPEPDFENVTCLNCGEAMGDDDDACGKCGWTYAGEVEDDDGSPGDPPPDSGPGL